MGDYEEIERDDRLAVRLRREARRTQPAFSAELHERLMAAVQAAAPNVTAPAVRRARGRALAWGMTVAATLALALALAIAANHSPTHPHDSIAEGNPANSGNVIPQRDATPKNVPIGFDNAAEQLANSASGISDWVRSTAGDSQWGGLDRDAQRALAAVAGSLPFDLKFSVASADGD
jgi:hypothetical protein